MKIGSLVVAAIGLIVVSAVSFFIFKKKPQKLKVEDYVAKWKRLQSFCRDKATWSLAIIDADKLLDSALKKRRFGGRSMGERLVSAQHSLTNNDGIWFAHNLCKKIITDSDTRLKEVDVKAALVAYRQALKDIGALPNGDLKDA